MIHQLIKVVSFALAAFIISYLVSGVVDRFGFDTSAWYVGGGVILITLLLLFGVLALFYGFVSKRAK